MHCLTNDVGLQGRCGSSFLAWCTKNRYPAPVLPAGVECRPEHHDETKALPRGVIERQLSRRDVPLREKTLWRMLYETAARARSWPSTSQTSTLKPAGRRSPPRAGPPSGSTGLRAPRTCCHGSSGVAVVARCSSPSADRGRPGVSPPRTSAPAPEEPGSATTGPGSSSAATPAGSSTSSGTRQPPTSARRTCPYRRSWPGPGIATPAPPCATSNQGPKPSPRSPSCSISAGSPLTLTTPASHAL